MKQTMMKTTYRTTLRWPLVLFLMAGILTACGGNPVEDDHDEHAEVEGMVLEMGGVEIFRAEELQQTGQITVQVGSETDHIDVIFLDHDGEEIHADELSEEDFTFGYVVADPTVARITQEGTGAYAFRVEGLKVDTTTATIGLFHGGDHFDFSRDVTVVVTD